MARLTETLRQHHKHCDDLFVRAEAAVAERDWPDARRYLPEYLAAMAAHFRCEEETLFPAFEAATGMSAGPTQVMRAEHAQMRELFDRLASALAAGDAQGFAGTAETLLILMQQHNMKEENILYPMCDRGLSSQVAALEPVLRNQLDVPCSTDG